ncbi:hypothetical protein SESBI_03160 [Sesbania bispinosa]|nr:hypothetical protein SESBI_03160 [Sesbania bispinosa]
MCFPGVQVGPGAEEQNFIRQQKFIFDKDNLCPFVLATPPVNENMEINASGRLDPRGAKRKGLSGLLKDAMRNFRVSFLTLIETHVKGDFAQTLAQRLGFHGIAISEAVGFAGGIWCFWDPSVWNITVIRITPQVIHLCINQGQNSPWFISIYYGSPHPHLRSLLRDDLSLFSE